jgi:hypothetical protein
MSECLRCGSLVHVEKKNKIFPRENGQKNGPFRPLEAILPSEDDQKATIKESDVEEPIIEEPVERPTETEVEIDGDKAKRLRDSAGEKCMCCTLCTGFEFY